MNARDVVGKLGTHSSAVYRVRGDVRDGERVSIRSDQDRRVSAWTDAVIDRVDNQVAGREFVYMSLS